MRLLLSALTRRMICWKIYSPTVTTSQTQQGTAADSPIVAEMGGTTSGSARDSADEESKGGDASTAESVDAAAADAARGNPSSKRIIITFPIILDSKASKCHWSGR